MKKIISIMLTVLMLACVFVPCVSASEDEEVHGGFGTTIYVSDVGYHCFIKTNSIQFMPTSCLKRITDII